MAFLLEGGARKTWAAEKVEFDKKAKLERFRKLYEKKLVNIGATRTIWRVRLRWLLDVMTVV